LNRSSRRARNPSTPSRQSRGGKLDRERNPVEAPANLDHGWQIGRGQCEARIDGLRTRLEQLECAEFRDRFGVCCGGHRERPEAIHVLVGGPEGFLARHEDGDVRCAGGHGVDERRHGVGQM
jgi:hypothetical protein